MTKQVKFGLRHTVPIFMIGLVSFGGTIFIINNMENTDCVNSSYNSKDECLTAKDSFLNSLWAMNAISALLVLIGAIASVISLMINLKTKPDEGSQNYPSVEDEKK